MSRESEASGSLAAMRRAFLEDAFASSRTAARERSARPAKRAFVSSTLTHILGAQREASGIHGPQLRARPEGGIYKAERLHSNDAQSRAQANEETEYLGEGD